jgi:hypothetical protein
MPKHSGSDGFQTGLPGISDECFKEQKPSERYYYPHNKRLAVLKNGCWETFRDVEPDEGSPAVGVGVCRALTRSLSPFLRRSVTVLPAT